MLICAFASGKVVQDARGSPAAAQPCTGTNADPCFSWYYQFPCHSAPPHARIRADSCLCMKHRSVRVLARKFGVVWEPGNSQSPVPPCWGLHQILEFPRSHATAYLLARTHVDHSPHGGTSQCRSWCRVKQGLRKTPCLVPPHGDPHRPMAPYEAQANIGSGMGMGTGAGESQVLHASSPRPM